jgi:hypothetical protein
MEGNPTCRNEVTMLLHDPCLTSCTTCFGYKVIHDMMKFKYLCENMELCGLEIYVCHSS